MSSKTPGWFAKFVMESKLALLSTRQANESKRRGVEARNTTFFRKLASREDGRLMSWSNHLPKVWMLSSFTKSEKEKQ